MEAPLLDDLYREVILDHYQYPRRKGTLDNPSVVMDGKNPLCGDELTLYLGLDGDTVADVAWEGQGCSICMASASMLAEQIKGKTRSQATAMIEAFVGMMHGKPLPQGLDLGDVDVLEGVQKFPVRVKCALLPWTTLQEGLKRKELTNDNERISFSY
jgi:nitrogen fixation protein NifU and related proteins